MLIGMLVGWTPQDNHTPLLLRTTRKHQKKIKEQLWNPFSQIKLWHIDNSKENKSAGSAQLIRGESFPSQISTTHQWESVQDSTSPVVIYSGLKSFWVTALVSGLCDLKPRATVMSTIKYQYRNTNFWSGVWVNWVSLFACMAKSINWSPLTSLLFNIIQEKSTVTHISLTHTNWNIHLLRMRT